MKFMMFMMPGLSDEPWGPTPEAAAVMGRFNSEMSNAGVLLELNGLHSPAKAARVSFRNGNPTVTDGPFAESKEVIGGYWMIEVGSKEEALDWAKRCPSVGGDFTIEVRQVYELADFPAEVREALGAV